LVGCGTAIIWTQGRVMHFEFLVEGQTELTALSILLRNIIGEYEQPHTWKIHKHRGIGKIPDDPALRPNKSDQTLLHNLPSKLRAYGKEMRDNVVVTILVDLDDKNCNKFKSNLTGLLEYCEQRPKSLFCIAIEELEAWFFGDRSAIEIAYPDVNCDILDNYEQDSICHTWEKLAEAIHPGGFTSLSQYGKRSNKILEQKRVWAKDICPNIDVENNLSPSFQYFRDRIRGMATK